MPTSNKRRRRGKRPLPENVAAQKSTASEETALAVKFDAVSKLVVWGLRLRSRPIKPARRSRATNLAHHYGLDKATVRWIVRHNIKGYAKGVFWGLVVSGIAFAVLFMIGWYRNR